MKKKILTISMLLTFALTILGKTETMVNATEITDKEIKIGTYTINESDKEIEANIKNIITGGTSIKEAQPLRCNTLYHGETSGGETWLSFKTNDKKGNSYSIVLENLTPSSEDLSAFLVDINENPIIPDERNYYADRHAQASDEYLAARADESGTRATGTFNNLDPNTTYYLRIQSKSEEEYMLSIHDSSEGGNEYLGKMLSEENDRDEDTSIVPGTSQNSATLLKKNTYYQGDYKVGYEWVAFRTGELEGTEYYVSLEKLVPGNEKLSAFLVDVYGNPIIPNERNYYADRHAQASDEYLAARADESGTRATGTFKNLEPNTTYYLRIQSKSEEEYMLIIHDSSENIAYLPSNLEEKNTLKDESGYIPGVSQSYSVFLPVGTKVFGHYYDGYAWLAFTTNEVGNVEYAVSVVNCTQESEEISAFLVDVYGNPVIPNERNYYANELAQASDEYLAARADKSGTAATGFFDNLKPNSTYFICIKGKESDDYSVVINTIGSKTIDNETSTTLEESKSPLNEEDEFYTGTNQNQPTLLKVNTYYHGDYQNGYSWVAFRTGEQEGTEYGVSLENHTPSSEKLSAFLVDVYGNPIIPNERNYYANELAQASDEYLAARADESGTRATGIFNNLEPNTTYYLRIQGEGRAEYILYLGTSYMEEQSNTIKEEAVFAVPFELNDTYIRFKADSAEFLDLEDAIEALRPVAEVILQYPEQPILLAGTTATLGEQAGAVELSEKRAAAVKDLLVKEFGIPEKQLISKGLGFEADPFVRGKDIDPNGNFVETEAAKNRRVVIVNAESDIAKQILGK